MRRKHVLRANEVHVYSGLYSPWNTPPSLKRIGILIKTSPLFSSPRPPFLGCLSRLSSCNSRRALVVGLSFCLAHLYFIMPMLRDRGIVGKNIIVLISALTATPTIATTVVRAAGSGTGFPSRPQRGALPHCPSLRRQGTN